MTTHAAIDPLALVATEGMHIAASVTIAAYAVVKAHSTLEDCVVVDHHAVLGGLPQDLHFKPETVSGIHIGARTVIREGVTVNRATRVDGHTRVGHDCLLMANSHVGHDCAVGNHAVLANGVLLGGFVTVGDYAFLGGGAVFHQFVRVGEGAMISGGSRMSLDVPPFTIASDYNVACGLNLVGLKRRGFSQAVISDLKACYRALYFHPGNQQRKAAAHKALTPQGQAFLDFFQSSERGCIHSKNERPGRNG